jgi:hypothetical protein
MRQQLPHLLFLLQRFSLWQSLDGIDFHFVIHITGWGGKSNIRIGSRRDNTIQINGDARRIIELRCGNITLVRLFGDLGVGQDIKVHVRVCIRNVVPPSKDRIPVVPIAYLDDDPIQEYTRACRTLVVNQIPTGVPIDSQVDPQCQGTAGRQAIDDTIRSRSYFSWSWVGRNRVGSICWRLSRSSRRRSSWRGCRGSGKCWH